MDGLKEFIDAHRSDFDSESLPDGHTERFEKRLHRSGRIVRRVSLLALVAAAAACLVFFVKLHEGLLVNPGDSSPATFFCEADEEIDELCGYYNMQMYEVVTEINEGYADNQTPGIQELLEASEEVVQATYDFEEEVLPSLPCTEDGLFTINRHYDASLQSLHFMLEQMKEMTTNNTH
jgi:hypothetical protein